MRFSTTHTPVQFDVCLLANHLSQLSICPGRYGDYCIYQQQIIRFSSLKIFCHFCISKAELIGYLKPVRITEA